MTTWKGWKNNLSSNMLQMRGHTTSEQLILVTTCLLSF